MKIIAIIVALALPAFAQVAGQYKIPKKNVGAGWSDQLITPAASSVWTWDGSNAPSSVTLANLRDAANLTGTLAAARIADGSLGIAKVTGLQTALDGKANLTGGNTITGNQSIAGNIFIPSTEGGTDGVTIAQDTHPREGMLGWPSVSGTFAVAAATSGRVAPSDMTGMGTGVATALAAATNGTGGLVTWGSSPTFSAITGTSLALGSAGLTINGRLITNGGTTNTGPPGGERFRFWNNAQGATVDVYTAVNPAIACSATTFDLLPGSNQALRAYSSGGVFIGASPSDPGAGTLKATNLTATGAITTTPNAHTATTAAISIATGSTDLTTTAGAQPITLANGSPGQTKVIKHVTDGGSAVLTPATATGWTTATFTNAGDTLTLEYSATGGWYVRSFYGTTVAP